MKLNKQTKAALKSYLRAVAASGITVALSIAGNMKPEYSVILGALVAPLIKALDPADSDLGVNAS